MRRRGSHDIVFEKDGYPKRTIHLEAYIQPAQLYTEWFIFWPALFDWPMGAGYDFEFSFVHGALAPK